MPTKTDASQTVLVVDDDATIRKLLSVTLEAEGYTTIEAADGIEALAVLEREKIDAVISDILMPRMDGYRLCQEVRKNERLAGLTFIIYSGTFTTAADERLALGMGVDKYIRKPAPIATLIAALREQGDRTPAALANQVLPSAETEVLKEYNEALVRKLEERNFELSRSNEDLERFAYAASHDLKEPLRAIFGFARLLECGYADCLDAKAKGYLRGVTEGAERMEQLIDGVLEYSSLEACGREQRTIDAQEALDFAREHLAGSIQEAGARVTSDPLPSLRADETQLAQLFENLIGNALKFRGDRPPEIHVGARMQDGGWLFSVRDNGIGVEPQFRERVFEIFQRLHSRAKYPGTGIGLAISKRIVERHGGRIWVESQPGEGATFFFTIGTQGDRACERRDWPADRNPHG